MVCIEIRCCAIYSRSFFMFLCQKHENVFLMRFQRPCIQGMDNNEEKVFDFAVPNFHFARLSVRLW